MRKAILMAAAVALCACGPSEDEFRGACMARCLHLVNCGLGVPDGHYNCPSYCDSEWEFVQERSVDCQFYVEYFFDCQAETSCDALQYEHCLGQLGDVVASCEE